MPNSSSGRHSARHAGEALRSNRWFLLGQVKTEAHAQVCSRDPSESRQFLGT